MRDRGHVDFLECVGAHHGAAHLAGQGHERHVVHHRIHDAGDQIRRARAGRRDAHTRTAGRAREAAGGKDGRGLMAYEHMLYTMIVECIVKGHDRAARIAEHRFDSQALECIENDRCARARVHDEPPVLEKQEAPPNRRGLLLVRFRYLLRSSQSQPIRRRTANKDYEYEEERGQNHVVAPYHGQLRLSSCIAPAPPHDPAPRMRDD